MRFHAFISGEVQGVGFRMHTLRIARTLHVNGWVRNLFDGRVEIVAEGPKHILEEFEGWLNHGPSMAHVEKVDIQYNENEEGFRDFRVEETD